MCLGADTAHRLAYVNPRPSSHNGNNLGESEAFLIHMNTNDNIFRIDHLLRIDHLHVKRTQAELGALQPHTSTAAQIADDEPHHSRSSTKGNARGISSGRNSKLWISELVSASPNPVNTKTTTTLFFRPSSCIRVSLRIPFGPSSHISHPKRPDQRVERKAQIAEIASWPQRRVLVDADDAVKQQRWFAASLHPSGPITLIEGVTRVDGLFNGMACYGEGFRRIAKSRKCAPKAKVRGSNPLGRAIRGLLRCPRFA